MKRTLKGTNVGTAPEVEFKVPGKCLILEVNAGFGTYSFGTIKASMSAKKSTEHFSTYFVTGITVPTPGGDHVSIFSWHGSKLWDGDLYTLKIIGRPPASCTLYAEIVIEDDVEAVLAGGPSSGVQGVVWTNRGAYPEDDATTGATNFSEDTSNHIITVPAGERWELQSIAVKRSDSAALTVTHFNSADVQLKILTYSGAATGWHDVGQQTTYRHDFGRYVLKAGDYIKFTFGAAQGATAQINVRYFVVKV